ncbi:alpha/beta hydrolase [Foetidibacter luteolus]|uniref:alpha/beta hydrolase n=1 Tax=Foetidibacter luteolus TaxID=2608880 RepID=UPI00129BAA7D|nr:alpha/beta hydrolase [Foetidibacter luteolus]
MNYQDLKYIYKPSGKNGAYTLLLLHGTGGDETDLLPLAEKFGSDLNVLSLRGNVLESGMPRFFKRLGMGIFDEQDLAFRTHEMVAFIRKLATKENFDAHKVIALGYSNGANIAGSTLVMYPDFFAGAVLYRPMQPFKKMPEVSSQSHAPVFMSNGSMDPTIQPGATEKYIEWVKQSGYDVEAYEVRTGHGLTQQDLQLSVQWFQKNFNTVKAAG